MSYQWLGAYTISEAARLTGGHTSTIYSWFKCSANESRKGIFTSDYSGTKHEKTISFYDLIDVKIAVELKRRKVSMQRIRKVYTKLGTAWSTAHPFCYRRFYICKNDVYAEIQNEHGAEMLIDVLTDQGFDRTVMTPFLDSLEFDPDSELAERWMISDGVILDPCIRFGMPVIRDTRIPAEIIAATYRSEGNDDRYTAGLYGISQTEVKNAVAFCDKFRRQAA